MSVVYNIKGILKPHEAPNPKEVVINEAVELAKKFSTDKSPKFINGVLADVVKDIL